MTISDIKAKIHKLQLERDTVRAEIHSLEEKAEKARLEYLERRDIANAKSQAATARLAELADEIAQAQLEVDVADFQKLSQEIDRDGETPERLARWKKLTGALRSGGRIGQSHEHVLSILDRLQGKGKPLPPDMLTYSGIAKNWVKEPRNEPRISSPTLASAAG